MSDQNSFREGFEEGRRVGQRDEFGPRGIPSSSLLPGAQYEFRRSYFDSFVQYERDVLANLRHLQMVRWGREREPELGRLEQEVRTELRRAREAVDAELEADRGRSATVAALRATPQVPSSVREYRDPREFLLEDPRRGHETESGSVELGGADFGFWWGLEHPFKRWLTTGWRISWLCETEKFMFGGDGNSHSDKGDATTELYAVESLKGATAVPPPRVWLLGKLRTRAAVDRALGDFDLEAMRERNSLVAAAEAVARVAREEGAENWD